MIQVNDIARQAHNPYGIAPRRRACWTTKAHQGTQGVRS